MTYRENKKLNIAHIHWGFPPIIGGVETHLAFLLPEMVRNGHKVGLLTGSVEKGKVRYQYKGVEIFRSPLFDLNWLYRRGLEGIEEEVTATYTDFFNQIKPNIVHTHNMHYFSEVHTKILEKICQEKGIPLILTAHNVWDDMLFLKLTRGINWSHIIAVSHYIKKELTAVGLDEEKITVIHHGIDVNMFHPEVKPIDLRERFSQLKGKKIVLHPARIGMAKGADVSIKAINKVRERIPEVMLILTGTKNIIDWGETQEKDIAYFIDLVKVFNLKANVLIDFFKYTEMPELYSLADVCIYPSSVSEPFGLTMLEALATAKPMIVTNAGGMPEVIRDGINGYVIKVRDVEALAHYILCLLEDGNLARRLGRTGREMVEKHYTKEMMTELHLDVYMRFLSR